jgi:hypothetical protein
MEDFPSTLLLTQAGRKSHLSKAKERAAVEILKGTQATITRALRAGKSLPSREK